MVRCGRPGGDDFFLCFLVSTATAPFVALYSYVVGIDNISELNTILLQTPLLAYAAWGVMLRSFPDYCVDFMTRICPPLGKDISLFFEESMRFVEIRLTPDNMEIYTSFMKRYGRFIYELHLHGNEIEGEGALHLLTQFLFSFYVI